MGMYVPSIAEAVVANRGFLPVLPLYASDRTPGEVPPGAYAQSEIA
jgi:hypothetical protein